MKENLLFEMRRTKRLGDRALAQLDDADWGWRPDAEANSIAIIVQHLHGNMLSRWTDFLTSDGEKPTRDRDGEFEPKGLSTKDLLARWEEGWRVCLSTIESLADADFARTVRIRDEPLSVVDAILRQLAHYAYHVGQIAWIARARRGAGWKSLSIPKGKSREHVRGNYKRG